MRALLVVNPAATSTSERARDVLVHALAAELELDVDETGWRGHAAELAARATASGVELVIALGGDGTVNEVVNGLLGDGPFDRAVPHPMFAVVPGGSTNVLARTLGLPGGSGRGDRSVCWMRCGTSAPDRSVLVGPTGAGSPSAPGSGWTPR